MDVGIIKEFSTKVKNSAQREIPNIVEDYFGKMKHEKLMEDLLEFSGKFPMYRKLLTPVVKYLKKPVFCVYVLMCEGVIVYVGKSTDVCLRLNTHAKEKDFNEVYIIETKDKRSQDFCENSLIWKYKPKYNKNVNIKLTNEVVNFDKEAVKLLEWLNHTTWFSNVSQQLQTKLGCKFEPKGFNCFVDNNYSINFKTDISFVTLNEFSKVSKPEGRFGNIEWKLKQVAEGLYKPELFSVVSNGVYKFGKFYVTSTGRWRVEGGKTWYLNVNIDKIIQNTLDSFNVVDIDCTTLDCVPIWFGKYRGKKYADVQIMDPNYCDWILKTFKDSDLMRLGVI